jgi:hypothetical protein
VTTSLSGLGGVGTPGIVGTVKPEWDIPGHGISDRLRGFLMRVDAGESGLNAAEDMPPEVIDEFRRMVNAGILKPKNEAAMNIARSRGGLQAGDMTLLGPLIDGMPEGLTPEYWGIVLGRAQQAAQEQIAIMDRTGYFEGKSTLERQRIEADISNNIARTEIERSLADNTIRQTDLDEAYRRDAMAQDMRQNIIAQFGYDPGPQGAAGAAAGNQQASMMEADGTLPMPGSPQQQAQMQRYTASQGGQQLGGSTQIQAPGAPPPTGPDGQPTPAPGTQATQATQGTQGGAPGVAGQYPQVGSPGAAGGAPRPNMTTQVGSDIGWQFVDGRWQQTLGGRQQDLAQQQQAFAQQQAQAELASNPRNYIQAQMLGGARGGLGGMAPNNQVDPTTGMPYAQPPGMQGQQWPAVQRPMSGMPGMPAQPVPDGQPMMGIEPWQRVPQQGMPGQLGQPAPTPQPGGMPGADGLSTAWMGMANQAQQGAAEQMKAAQMAQFQAPGNAGMGATGMQANPMAQPMGMQQPQPGQQNIAVGAFSQALNRNRLVPKSGAMGTQGAMMGMGDIQSQTNPQKWRAQDFMRGNASEKAQALGTASAAGFSDEDTQSMLGKNLPTFRAPGAGAMM